MLETESTNEELVAAGLLLSSSLFVVVAAAGVDVMMVDDSMSYDRCNEDAEAVISFSAGTASAAKKC